MFFQEPAFGLLQRQSDACVLGVEALTAVRDQAFDPSEGFFEAQESVHNVEWWIMRHDVSPIRDCRCVRRVYPVPNFVLVRGSLISDDLRME